MEHVSKIYLTNDQKYFIVGTTSDVIGLFSARNNKKITQFSVHTYIDEIKVNNQDKNILVFNRMTGIDKIDLKTFQISMF